jgi:hypothetical protein
MISISVVFRMKTSPINTKKLHRNEGRDGSTGSMTLQLIIKSMVGALVA